MTVDEQRLYTHLLPCRYCGRMPMLESSTKTLIVCDSDNQILHGAADGEIKHRMTCQCGGHSHLKLRDAITKQYTVGMSNSKDRWRLDGQKEPQYITIQRENRCVSLGKAYFSCNIPPQMTKGDII